MGEIIVKRIRGMNWMAKVSLILTCTVFLSIFLFAPDEAAAATYYSRASAAWNVATTWSTAGCGGAAAGAFPVAGDTVTICNGNAVTISLANAAATNVTVQDGGTLSVGNYTFTVSGTTTVGGGTSGILAHSGVAAKTYTGAVTINSGGQWTNAGNAPITFGNNLTNNGSFASGAGVQTFSGASAILTHSGTAFTAGAGSFTMSGATQQIVCDATHGFTIPTLTSTAVTNNCTGGLTVSTSLAGTLFTQGTNAVLNIGTTAGVTTLTATANPNTVNYSGAAQTVKVTTYHHLTLSGSGAKTGAVTTVGGNLTLSGTATYTTGANLAITGNLDVGAGTTLTTGATFTLSVTDATSVTGTLANTGTGAKTYIGKVTINPGGVWTNATSAINFRGGLTNNGTTFTAGTGIYTFNTNNQEIGGTSATAIPSVTVTGVTLTNNITTGTGLTVATALIGTGGLTQGTNAVLTIGGTSTVTTLTATASGNTVNYNANGAQAACKVTIYNNLTLSVAGIKTFATTPTVNGILSIEGTATVVVTTGVVTYGANATLQYKTTDVRTVTLEEWLATTAATGGVIIANTAGSITMNAAKVFNNSVPLTINSGATLATGNFNLTLGGNFVNNGGTFTAGTSTVLFNGTGNQSISGSNTWYNLSITAAAARTVTFESGKTQTISNAAGSLTLTGASATQPLTLAPSSATTAWLLNKNASITPSISNVAVSFSDASSGGEIVANNGTNSNAGNNTNWKFAGGSIVSCVGCHGYKATFPDGTARNTPDGAFRGSHNEHVVTYSNVCSVCHVAPGGETSADFDHRNSTVAIANPINGLAGSTYSKTSFTQANSFTPGTCANTYCHSNGTSVITLSIPANTSTTWGGTATCTSCHGVGGGDDGRPNYANNSPKRNTHGDGASYGVTHKATACPTCHTGISGTAGAYTVDPATHNNGAYNLQVSMGYTQLTGNCLTSGGCHGSVNWGASLPCLDCHDAITDDGIGPTRRAMSTEVTTFTWSHKKTAGAWTSYDCGVCHMEGDPATGFATALHKNNLLEFRDPDLGTTIKGVTFGGANPGSYTSTAVDATAATFARDTGTNTLEAFAQAVQVNLCLKCHDGGANAGAASALARVPGGTATKPFGAAAGTVLDISAHFATTNATYHPVSGKQNNSYANANTINAPWNFTKVPPSNAIYGYLMTCWDCHDSSAAPRTIGGAVASVTAHGNAVTLRAAYNAVASTATALCVVCHKTSVYWTTTTHAVVGLSALNGDPAEWPGHHSVAEPYYGCTQCHGTTTWAGVLPARPNRAINAHGFNTIADGVTLTWPVSGARPYSFMRCSNNMNTWNPTGGVCDNNTSMCGRSEAGAYTPGGTY